MMIPLAPAPATTDTHCPYCAFQCGMTLVRQETGLSITPRTNFPVNRGALCVKGWTAVETLTHPDRLRTPLVRTRGALRSASWEAALDVVAARVQEAQARHGRDSIGVFGGGSLTNEKAYLLGKFARVALRTSNIDYNGRFCMSSAAAASIRAFGLDRGLPFPLADIAQAEVILLVGSNLAETMPPAMQYLQAQRERGGQLIVVDPRASLTVQAADLHLQLTPGTDLALANGLLHVVIRDGLADADYIRQRTAGFEMVRGVVAKYWPERVERITGVPESAISRAARLLGTARTAMILSARGTEQHAKGVDSVLGWINLALATGRVGRPFSGYGCLTGQGNGQGGREHGQKADQLPGYRKITDPEARRHVAAVWNVDEADLPGPGQSAYEMLDTIGDAGGVRALLVFGANPAVSAPHAGHVQERLRKLDFLAVADFFLSETSQLADVVFPSAQWAEEEGTVTNLEGRVIRRRRAMIPPPDARTDLEIISTLAARLGHAQAFSFATSEDVFAELRRASAGGPADYGGITYAKVDAADGVFWPCASEDDPGTPRLFTDGFPTPDRKARFVPVEHGPAAEEPDADYPLYLTTGRVLAHYQSGTQTRRVPRLRGLSSEPSAEVHPAVAQRYGLTDGDEVILTTRRGSARFRTKVTATIRPDTIFVPFHWGGDQAANQLTNPALDPVSRMPEFKVCAVRVARRESKGAP